MEEQKKAKRYGKKQVLAEKLNCLMILANSLSDEGQKIILRKIIDDLGVMLDV